LGLIENMKEPQNIALWPAASEEVNSTFTVNGTPRNGLQKVEQRMMPKNDKSPEPENEPQPKPLRSKLVHINHTLDITEGQINAPEAVLAKHEALFTDHLGLAIEPEEDWLRIPLYSGGEHTIKIQQPYRLGREEHKLIDQVFDEQRKQDFILGLPPSKKFAHGEEEFNAAVTATDKFTKAVMILPGKDTYTALEWAIRFWQLVYPHWGLPSGIVLDQDLKFLSEF